MKKVRHFVQNDRLPPELNQTNLVLIPKVDNAFKVGQFRPRSLCNVIYKLISEILATQFKRLLSRLVSPDQLAFVLGWNINDNYIVATELFHGMIHKRGNGGWMTRKADMEKTYDRVEWNFLIKVI